MGSRSSSEGSHLGRASHMAGELFYLTEHADGCDLRWLLHASVTVSLLQ